MKKTTRKLRMALKSDPYGIRTHDTTVKGWCLNHLTNGSFKDGYDLINYSPKRQVKWSN